MEEETPVLSDDITCKLKGENADENGNYKFSKATLMDWEAEKDTEESYDFTFEDWDFLDLIIA